MAMSIEQAVETTIETRYLSFAARRWGDPNGLPVLALHGWLDNAASFDRLAPCLPQLQLVAIDLAGHGHSEHRPVGMKYHYVDYIDDVMAIADALGWERFALLGHSLGAGIACVVASSFPERITHLMLLEGIGPMSREADTVSDSMFKSVQQMKRQGKKMMPIYPDVDSAVVARTKVGDMNPDSIQILVQRNLKEKDGGVMWRSDPRLKLGSALYMVEDQVRSFLKGITAPTLLVTGKNGLIKRLGRLNERAACIQSIQQAVVLEGGHHLHLDDPIPVSEEINRFLGV